MSKLFIPTCDCCGNPAKLIWQDGKRRSNADHYSQCDREKCFSYLCEECGEVDDEGVTTCIDCLQQDAIRTSHPTLKG